jgi:hypothetical protein
MPQPYTDQEVQGAVEKILRSSIRRPINQLGSRDTGVTFNDFQEQTIAVLTLTPNAPFYMVKLGVGRLLDKVEAISSVTLNLDEAVQALGRYPTNVASVAELANARVAADALSLAGSSRTTAFRSIEQLPAFQRLDRNIESFLTSYSAPNLRRGGQIVRTKREGEVLVPGFVADLKEAREELIELVGSLANAINNYEAMDLPQLLSSGVMERAAKVIEERTNQMTQLLPQDRVALLRDATLDLIAARAIIRNFGSLRTPTLFLPSEGTGGAYADATYPATPARLVMTLPGPYATRVDSDMISSQLDFLIDGTFRTVVSVAGSFVAQLIGRLPETFTILAAPPDERNDEITVKFIELGVTTEVVVALTAGTRTAQQIADNINTAIAAIKPFEAVVAINPRKFEGKVDVAGVGPYTFTLTNSFSSWIALGVVVGDRIQVLEGANLLSVFTVTIVAASVLTATQDSGPAVTPELNKLVSVGIYLVVKLKLLDTYVPTALANGTALSIGPVNTIVSTVGQTPSSTDQVRTRACSTLGFSSGVVTTSRAMPTDIARDLVNASTLTAQAGVSRLRASITATPITLGSVVLEDIQVHTDPSRPTTAFVYRFRGIGDITVGGLAATFVIPGLTPGVLVGDEIVVRSTTIPADMNQRGVVTSVSATTVTATFTSALTITSGVTVDISPDLTGLPANAVLVVDDGSNRGTYRVNQQGATIKSELLLNRAFQSAQDFSGQPIFLVGDLALEYLTVESTKLDLTTAMQLDDGSPTNPYSAAYLFATPAPTLLAPYSSVGITPWFTLEDLPSELQVGDVLELYLTSIETKDLELAITSIDATNRVLGVDPPVSTTLPIITFGVNATAPFGRIRRVRRDRFDEFETGATQWLERPQFQPPWLTQLDRLVTVVLASPTSGAINDLRLFLRDLLGLLTIDGAASAGYPADQTIQAIAEAYEADVVAEVDTLVESLLQQGADRAVDILLEGRFSQYFGFSVDEMSYAGNVLALTKQVMQQDLPVRSVRRGEFRQQQVVLGSFEEPDFEFDQQDIDTGIVPDSPGGNPPPRQGDAY